MGESLPKMTGPKRRVEAVEHETAAPLLLVLGLGLQGLGQLRDKKGAFLLLGSW